MAAIPEEKRMTTFVLLQMGTWRPGNWGWLQGGAQPVPPAVSLDYLLEPRLPWRARVGPTLLSVKRGLRDPCTAILFQSQPCPLLSLCLPLCFSLCSFSLPEDNASGCSRDASRTVAKGFCSELKGLSLRMWTFLPESSRV